MRMQRYLVCSLLLIAVLAMSVCGCQGTPSPVAAVATATQMPPTSTSEPPTATPVPPTSTPEPPTATPVPPTSTPEPPTATPIPSAENCVACHADQAKLEELAVDKTAHSEETEGEG